MNKIYGLNSDSFEEKFSHMRFSGSILSELHGLLSNEINEGVSGFFLDKLAEEFIKDHNAYPSFKGYHGYPNSICFSVNDCVVHGIPKKNVYLKPEDLVTLDLGVCYKNYHTDSAYTYYMGNIDENKEIFNFLKSTLNSLYCGISAVEVGGNIGDIGEAIYSSISNTNYSIVDGLEGHGVGKNLHEKPSVPNFGKKGHGEKILNGMAIAIEPICSMGKKQILQSSTEEIFTKDHSLSAHFEHTVGIFNNRIEILTSFERISPRFLIDINSL